MMIDRGEIFRYLEEFFIKIDDAIESLQNCKPKDIDQVIIKLQGIKDENEFLKITDEIVFRLTVPIIEVAQHIRFEVMTKQNQYLYIKYPFLQKE